MKKFRFITSIAVLMVSTFFYPAVTVTAQTYQPLPDKKTDINNAKIQSETDLDTANLTCAAGPISVMNANDSGAGSLRQAITDICPGGTINFDASLAGQTIPLTATLVLNKDLTIDGSTLATKIAVSGNNTVQVIKLNSNIAVTIESLVIKNGKAAEN